MESLCTGSLTFIGIGLWDTTDLTLHASNFLQTADKIYIEFYTSVVPNGSIREFENQLGKTIIPLIRTDLEDTPEQNILAEAQTKKIALLIPGDPMISTTHIDLRLRAYRMGIPTGIIHGISIQTAAMGASGLENYKFGPSITIPFLTETFIPESPYQKLIENLTRGLHTLAFLDIKSKENQYMTINQAINVLVNLEKRMQKGIIHDNRLVVGLSQVGSPSQQVKAGFIESILQQKWGPPPHMLIIPGKLHFIEADALIAFAGAPETIRI